MAITHDRGYSVTVRVDGKFIVLDETEVKIISNAVDHRTLAIDDFRYVCLPSTFLFGAKFKPKSVPKGQSAAEIILFVLIEIGLTDPLRRNFPGLVKEYAMDLTTIWQAVDCKQDSPGMSDPKSKAVMLKSRFEGLLYASVRYCPITGTRSSPR
jgi:hypothetical protein